MQPSAISHHRFARNPHQYCKTFIVTWYLLAMMPGCGDPQSGNLEQAQTVEHALSKSNDIIEDQSFDIGSVIGSDGRSLSHTYTIKNLGTQPVKLIQSINRKPCCGDVPELSPTILEPNQFVPFTINLKIGSNIGPLHHFAAIETDLPNKRYVRFSTVVNVYPQARIVETKEGSVPPTPGANGRRSFVISTYGTEKEPPVAIIDAALKATTSVLWVGSEANRQVDKQILERSRTFQLVLHSDDEPGYRSERLSLYNKERALLHYSFQWEIPRLIKATPGTIMVPASSAKVEKTVILSSADRRDFVVTSLQPDSEAIQSDWKDTGPSSVKAIHFSVDPIRLGVNKSSEIKIYTNHAGQPLAKIVVLVTPN